MMDKEKVKALAANVNSLIGNYQEQQQQTAKLFEICLEFLEDRKTGHEGGWMKLAIEKAKKREERKQQLIAAIKGYIKMINERENKHE